VKVIELSSSNDGTAGSEGRPTGRSWRPAAIAAIVFGALAVGVAGRGPTVLDRAIERNLAPVERSGLLEELTDAAPVAALALSCTTAVAAWWGRDRWTSAFCLISPLLAAGLASWVLKPAIARPWPGGSEFAFPSGHATMVTAVCAVCVVVVRDRRLGMCTRHAAALALVPAALLAAVVCLALVLLRHHFFTDVLGGALAAVVIVMLTVRALDVLRRSR
jgi:membrane-associated phospholipid phosphatase